MKPSPTSRQGHRLSLPVLVVGMCLGSLPFLNEVFSANPAPIVSIVLIKAGDEWRYRNAGTDPGPKWREVDYNDNDWRFGRAQLGYGEGDEVTITEGVATPHPTATYLRHAFDVPQPGA